MIILALTRISLFGGVIKFSKLLSEYCNSLINLGFFFAESNTVCIVSCFFFICASRCSRIRVLGFILIDTEVFFEK